MYISTYIATVVLFVKACLSSCKDRKVYAYNILKVAAIFKGVLHIQYVCTVYVDRYTGTLFIYIYIYTFCNIYITDTRRIRQIYDPSLK